MENEAQNELRGNLFIREQNFSRMINQIQSQIDELDRYTFQDETANGQNLLP